MRATGPCVLFVWCYVTRDLSLSHTDVPPPLSPPHLPPLLNTLACISTLRIAGRDSNVLLTDGSRWPMIHTVHVCFMMITRNNGFGRTYVTVTLCVTCVFTCLLLTCDGCRQYSVPRLISRVSKCARTDPVCCVYGVMLHTTWLSHTH